MPPPSGLGIIFNQVDFMVCFFSFDFQKFSSEVVRRGILWFLLGLFLSLSVCIFANLIHFQLLSHQSFCQVSSFQMSGRQILDLTVLQALSFCLIIQFTPFLSVVVGLHLLFSLQVHQFFLVASILTLCQLFNFLCLLDFMSLYPY